MIDWKAFEGIIAPPVGLTRAQIVAEARTWIDVPFVHQGDGRLGVDCAGLIKAVLMGIGAVPRDYLQRLPSEAAGYARSPDGVTLRTACGVVMRPILRSQISLGDIVLIAWDKARRLPQHMGIVADYLHGGLSMIHALGTVDGKGRVIEQRLSKEMLAKVVQAYALPGVA